jgi:hypothetical protein
MVLSEKGRQAGVVRSEQKTTGFKIAVLVLSETAQT